MKNKHKSKDKTKINRGIKICGKKKKFLTYKDAKHSLKKVQKLGNTLLNHDVYLCKSCDNFHIGKSFSTLDRNVELLKKIGGY